MDDCRCYASADAVHYPEVLPTPHQVRLEMFTQAVAQTPIPARVRLKINTQVKLPAHIERLGLKARTLEALQKMMADPALTRRLIEEPDVVLAQLAQEFDDPALAKVPGARKPAPLSQAVRLTLVEEGRS